MESNVLEALQLCPVFSGMSAPEIEIAMSGTGYRMVSYERHDIYALAGMPCQHADIIVVGELVCRMSSLSGRQVEVSRLRRGNIIAPAFLFGKDHKMPVGVETGTKVTLLRIGKDTFARLLRDNWQLARNFISVLSNTNVFLTRRMRVLSLLTVREKVAYLLLELSGEQGSDVVRLSRSRQEIADSFGIQKFSLIRVLSDMQEAGAIKIDGRQIAILDRDRLK